MADVLAHVRNDVKRATSIFKATIEQPTNSSYGIFARVSWPNIGPAAAGPAGPAPTALSVVGQATLYNSEECVIQKLLCHQWEEFCAFDWFNHLLVLIIILGLKLVITQTQAISSPQSIQFTPGDSISHLLMTTAIISLPLEWPPSYLPCLVEPNCMSHLQDFFMVLLQLEEGATSGVVVFKTSLRVEEGS